MPFDASNVNGEPTKNTKRGMPFQSYPGVVSDPPDKPWDMVPVSGKGKEVMGDKEAGVRLGNPLLLISISAGMIGGTRRNAPPSFQAT